MEFEILDVNFTGNMMPTKSLSTRELNVSMAKKKVETTNYGNSSGFLKESSTNLSRTSQNIKNNSSSGINGSSMKLNNRSKRYFLFGFSKNHSKVSLQKHSLNGKIACVYSERN